ncbi:MULTISPECIES: class I SAM-dependent methyltransferase [unclassified Hydrogenophaga]|uniref:class I SAM-dependent methyltransferase n=1 Tax=unclassified Hydrogenophaga TaxID=2610897 RepID=UPI00111316D9|nr:MULTISPECIES: class I SAM-dependent methyltransferase [unclassified Hydrogenophaga]MBN9371160.1 class I SAM-dependent methyltransferase [Hydrogenophaga sp.]
MVKARGARFSAGWLALREPFDAAARDTAAARLLPPLLACRPADGPWRVIDLGCGTGANLRWLAPRLGGAQQWLVLDHDAALLRRWASQPGFEPIAGDRLRWRDGGVEIVRRRLDLARDLPTLPWHAAHLVTASALLDLVGADWLRQLAALAAAARVPLLLSLSVDGRHHWGPADADDGAIQRLFAAHQQGDKGFGPALGARAVPRLAARLREQGYRVRLARSDWRIGGDGLALQRALIEGMARAAAEQDPSQAARVGAWRQRRLALAATGRVRVGHLELLAVPA